VLLRFLWGATLTGNPKLSANELRKAPPRITPPVGTRMADNTDQTRNTLPRRPWHAVNFS